MEIKMVASRPMTAEALKRNTDCVYFLASPLTCKKGNECEFRHSEGVRVNPRDCWYWLNGNCMNPKCLFRHPPLDGLFATSGVPSGPALPTSQHVSSTKMPTLLASGAHNSNKPSVPCYYFQKGQCLKGDECIFIHGLHPVGNSIAQQVTNGPPPVGGNQMSQQANVSTSFTGTPQTLSWTLKECTAQQNIPKSRVENPVRIPYSSAKSSNKAEIVSNNSLRLNKTPSPYPSEYEPPRSQPIVAPVSSDSTPSRPRHCQSRPFEEHHQNGREGGEFLGESSPGFDVIVDDDIGDSDYYNGKEFKRASVHDERNPSHSDYEPVASFERGQFNGKVEYSRYERGHSQHFQDRRRISSDRTTHRESSPHEVDGSDLRHRLLKQRRLSGSSSAVSHDYREEPHRCGDRSTGRDSWRPFPREMSIGSRLRGRITLPVRSEPDQPRSERGRERNRTRFSPIRRGRSRDGIRKRLNEDIIADGRGSGGRFNTRDTVDPLSFAGPKSLAQLKGIKNSVSAQEQSTKCLDVQVSEDSFEGPKSLTTLLKRKSSGVENDTRHAAVSGNKILLDSSAAVETKEGLIQTEVEELLITGQSCAEGTAHEVEEDGGMIVDAAEDQDLENYDDGYDYEEVEGGELKPEEDESNPYREDDEELDDEDEFAKKVGVFFT